MPTSLSPDLILSVKISDSCCDLLALTLAAIVAILRSVLFFLLLVFHGWRFLRRCGPIFLFVLAGVTAVVPRGEFSYL